MDKRIMMAIAIVIVVIAAAAITIVATSNDDDNGTAAAYNDSDVRLRIFGNADGNDIIDNDDVETIQAIIDANSDDDTTNDIDWKTNYYFADATHDGRIDSDDVQRVQDIIDKKSVKMWYENSFSMIDTNAIGENKHIDSYVNYPIGHKVGCEYNMASFLGVLDVYDYFSATDSKTVTTYGDAAYPGVSSLPVMGESNNLDLETLEQMYTDGTIDTVIMWSGGGSRNYIWEDAVKSGVADDISFVMVTCQGEHCINGILMLACMFGDQSLSDNYRVWYDGIMDKIDAIGTTIEKKKVLAVQIFEATTPSTIKAYGQYLSPALWFYKVFDFADNCANLSKLLPLGTSEGVQKELEEYGITEMVGMTQPAAEHTLENYNEWVEYKMNELFQNLPVYEEQKIYTIDFSLMPFFGGPAGCMILASYLYPEHFSMDEAMDLAQECIDNFMPVHHDAHYGYTYTGAGYYPYNG